MTEHIFCVDAFPITIEVLEDPPDALLADLTEWKAHPVKRILENWSIIKVLEPDSGRLLYLMLSETGAAGMVRRTSELVSIDPENRLARTLNSLYGLGEPGNGASLPRPLFEHVAQVFGPSLVDSVYG